MLIAPTDAKRLTGGQRRKPLLGGGEAVPVPFRYDGFTGTLLVASDGLFNYTIAHRIEQALLEPDVEGAANRLLELVRARSGGFWDDVSVIVCRERPA